MPHDAISRPCSPVAAPMARPDPYEAGRDEAVRRAVQAIETFVNEKEDAGRLRAALWEVIGFGAWLYCWFPSSAEALEAVIDRLHLRNITLRRENVEHILAQAPRFVFLDGLEGVRHTRGRWLATNDPEAGAPRHLPRLAFLRRWAASTLVADLTGLGSSEEEFEALRNDLERAAVAAHEALARRTRLSPSALLGMAERAGVSAAGLEDLARRIGRVRAPV